MLSRQSKSRTNLRKNNRGVTLIEVIAVVAVMSIVMAAVTGFIITGSKMSANVSGHAKDSMQEQTAVEYINRWIWAADTIEFAVKDPETNEFIEILIDGKSLKTKDGTVVFGTAAEDSWIKLCDGEITFERQVQEENVMDDVLVYILNGEKHVVHLRAGKIVSGND